MKSIVLIKQVPEAPSIQGEPGGPGTVGGDVLNVPNPFDLFAAEEALQTREKKGGEVTAITLGPDAAEEVLRYALAMGVNGAVHLKDPAFDDLDAPAVAKVLAAAVKKAGDVDLVFTGRQTIDTNSAVTPAMTARHLGMTLLSEVFRVDDIDPDGRTITVQRLLEGGLQVVRAKLPAVVAVTKDINEPRHRSMLGIRKASKAEIPVWTAADLGVSVQAVTKVSEQRVPPARSAGEILSGEPDELVTTLVDKLAEAKFI